MSSKPLITDKKSRSAILDLELSNIDKVISKIEERLEHAQGSPWKTKKYQKELEYYKSYKESIMSASFEMNILEEDDE